MPITIDVRDQTVKITAAGTITYQDALDLIAQRLADPTRTPGLPVLVDAREVQGAPSTSELRLIAADMKPLIDSGLGPIAVLTDSVCMYGIVRMFSVFAQTMSANVSAHRRMEDAELWLAAQRQTA